MPQASRAAKNLIYSGGQSMARSFVGGVKKMYGNFKQRQANVRSQMEAGTYKKNIVDRFVDRVLER